MGSADSQFDLNADVYCEEHVLKTATAFCTSHEKSICMSCIVEKVHLETDCKLQDIDNVDRNVKECLLLKHEISKSDSKLNQDKIESQMESEIEEAYSEALKKLEEYKSASYVVARRKVTELITRKRALYSQKRRQIDTAIDLYMSGNFIQGQQVKADILSERLKTEITFQKVIPSFNLEGKSLVNVTKNIPGNERKITFQERRFPPDERRYQRYPQQQERMRGTLTDIPMFDSDNVVDGKCLRDIEISKRVGRETISNKTSTDKSINPGPPEN